jgi:hypothetical protein
MSLNPHVHRRQTEIYLLDLIITPKTTSQPLVSNLDVLNTHHLSNHDLVVCNLSVFRVKVAAVSYTYRNIKHVDNADFEQSLRTSPLFSNPAYTPDAYLDQLESAVTAVLNKIAPIRRDTRAGGRK